MPILLHLTPGCFPPFLVILFNHVGHQHLLDFIRCSGISVAIKDELNHPQVIHRRHAF